MEKFKTLRHIETVRNFLSEVVKELLDRSVEHDQSKLEPPELEVFEEYTHVLRTMTYGSDEYYATLEKIKPALVHHYEWNSHHPEHHKNGIRDMNLMDLIEMLCDWMASSMRHDDGDIIKSIEINQKRFGYSDELKDILLNTARWLAKQDVYHKANES